MGEPRERDEELGFLQLHPAAEHGVGGVREGSVEARAARAGLFKDDRIDPLLVIRWKDIYEALEDAVDACETAAHRIGNILVKNA